MTDNPNNSGPKRDDKMRGVSPLVCACETSKERRLNIVEIGWMRAGWSVAKK